MPAPKPRIEPGNLPPKAARMLDHVYESVKERALSKGASEKSAQTKAAKQAWCSVKRYYYRKPDEPGARWLRRKKPLSKEQYPPGCAPYRGKTKKRKSNGEDCGCAPGHGDCQCPDITGTAVSIGVNEAVDTAALEAALLAW